MEVQSIPEKECDGFQKLVESNCRLKNQVISLQGNVREKKNKLKKLKWRVYLNPNVRSIGTNCYKKL